MRLLTLIFVTVLMAAVMLANVIAAVAGARTGQFENRTLAGLPPLTWSMLTQHDPGQPFSAFIRDNLPLRPQLIRWRNELVFAIGDSPVREVTRGRDGWLYMTDEISTWPCAEDADDDALLAAYDALHSAGQALGIEVYIAISPDKTAIHPEFLYPLDRARHESCAAPKRASLRRRLAQRAGFIDVWSAFEAERDRRRAHWPSDTWEQRRYRTVFRPRDRHWGNDGGYLQASAILTSVAPTSLVQRPIALQSQTYLTQDSELSRRFLNFYLPEAYTSAPQPQCRTQSVQLIASRQAQWRAHCEIAPDARSIVFFNDSFLDASLPYISDYFRDVTVLHWGTVNDDLSTAAEVAARANILVLQSVEDLRFARTAQMNRLAEAFRQRANAN